jgi:hypothetical protein
MKEVKFSPSKLDVLGKEINNPFDGHMVLSVPKYKERIEIVQKMGLEDDNVSNAIKLIDLVYARCKEVDLTHRETGTKINTLDDLGFSEEGSALINAAGKILVSGYQLGNP